MSTAAAAPAPEIDEKIVTELKLIWKGLPKLNYYQLLGVAPDADAGAIKLAFYRVSRDYHPDRYFRFPNENFRNAVNTIYKRISEGYTVLKTNELRRSYDAQIKADPLNVRFSIQDEEKRKQQGGSLYDGGTGPGKKYWLAAMEALRNKNPAGAKMQLQMAVGIEPKNEEFKAKFEELKALLAPKA